MPIVEHETVETGDDFESLPVAAEYSKEYIDMLDEEVKQTKAEIAIGTATTFEEFMKELGLKDD